MASRSSLDYAGCGLVISHHEYEEDRHRRLGADADRSHGVKYGKLARA